VVDSGFVTRYELLDRIGVGGMAEIFRGKAVAAGGFEKPVAIKRILPHLSQDERFVELLIAEAKVLSLLKHRNIVQIFDVGLGDDDQYFLVMEYVDGKDLGAVQRGLEARRRKMPFDLALHIGAEICEALEHAHSARAPDGKPMSLVHRDVSPSNVLLSRAGEVKLTDFGIAKRAESEATGHGAVRGKFAYISPEQARNEHLEPRSDVFSVGILLWELVTSRRLFSGLGDIEALRAVREAKVPRPRELDSRLAPEIDALIMSTLSREPRSRPTAGQLGARLRSLRYSLEATVGDPATELAKIIDTAEEVERASAHKVTPPSDHVLRADFEISEATVIRIHTADAFSMRDKDGSGMAHARAVIDRFEEEETRQAKLSADQMAYLRRNAPADTRDSGELTSTAEPPLPGVRPWRASAEATSARPPLSRSTASLDRPRNLESEDETLMPTDTFDSGAHFEVDEATRLRTPVPELVTPPRQLANQPPAMPGLPPVRAAASYTPPQGTVHGRSGPGRAPTFPPAATDHPSPGPSHPRGGATPAAPLPPPPVAPIHLPSPSLARERPPSPALASLVPPSSLPLLHQPALPSPIPQPAPPLAAQPPRPQMLAPSLPPPPALQQISPSNHGAWGASRLPVVPHAMHERSMPRPAARIGPRRGRPLQPWMLMIGALIMALLAFAVTRACLSTANKPAAASK
jgi:serine/threonine protein kinase